METITYQLHLICGLNNYPRLLKVAIEKFEEKQRDHDPIVNLLDGLIDAAYYLADTCVRTGLAHHSQLSSLKETRMVREFTEGAFGPMPTQVPTDLNSIQPNLEFVTIMILTELMEITYPNGKREEIAASNCLTCSVTAFPERNLSSVIQAIGKCFSLFSYLGGSFYYACFEEVHIANLRKGVLQPDGQRVYQSTEIAGKKKVIKPAGWTEPSLDRVIREMLS